MKSFLVFLAAVLAHFAPVQAFEHAFYGAEYGSTVHIRSVEVEKSLPYEDETYTCTVIIHYVRTDSTHIYHGRRCVSATHKCVWGSITKVFQCNPDGSPIDCGVGWDKVDDDTSSKCTPQLILFQPTALPTG